MEEAVLLITDTYKKTVNGISVFSDFFIKDFLTPRGLKIIVLEASTEAFYCIGFDETHLPSLSISYIYVNANFSRSDMLIREIHSRKKSFNFSISYNYKRVLISHGWPRIKFRFNYYGLYYWLKNIYRAEDLKRLLFYDEVIFISEASDAFRHKDYLYCMLKNIRTTFYDFSSKFISESKNENSLRLNEESLIHTNYILLIANFEKIKNLWWVLLYNLKSRFVGKNSIKKFVILVKPKKSVSYSFFRFLAKNSSIDIVNDQDKKASLLKDCRYLFITSYSEYNPIVALEAVAHNKKIVSLYKIEALVSKDYYHYLIE
jgi:hypothetical protein